MGMFSEIDYEVNWKRANHLLKKYKKELIELLLEEHPPSYQEKFLKMDIKELESYTFSKKAIYLIAKYQGVLELANTFSY